MIIRKIDGFFFLILFGEPKNKAKQALTKRFR